MIASVCRRILPTLAGCGVVRFRGLCRSRMQSSQSCMLALLSPWLARCMQSSQGILTAFLRTLLPRLGCGVDEVEIGFDMGVDGGGIVVFSLKEVRTGSAKDTVEVWLAVNGGSMVLSINLTSSSPGPSTSATEEAYGPGKHINASRTLPPRVILRKLHQRQPPVAVQSRADLLHTTAEEVQCSQLACVSRQRRAQALPDEPLRSQKQRQATTSSRRDADLIRSWECFFGRKCRSPGQAES